MCGRFYTDFDDAQYREMLAMLYLKSERDAGLLMLKNGEVFPTDSVAALERTAALEAMGVTRDAGLWTRLISHALTLSEPGWKVPVLFRVPRFGPFAVTFELLALDPRYQWAIVKGPAPGALFVLSRSSDVDARSS